MYGPVVFGNNAPDSGNAELLAAGMEMTGRDDIRERWLEPLLDGDDPLGVLDDRTGHRRQRPATPQDARRKGRRRVGDQRTQVVHDERLASPTSSIVMAVTNPDIHPYQGSSMFVVPVDTPGVTIVRDVGSMDDPEIHYGRSATTPRSSTRTCAFPRRT